MKQNENERLPQSLTQKSLGMEVSSLVDLVTTKIRELIIIGNYRPGQQLKEDELCRMFAISRPPIREAFKTLEANGLLVRKPRRGVFVAEFTAKDVEEVYTIIAMLYRKATDMAMEKIQDHHLDLMEECIAMMASSATALPPNVREYQLAHRRFHEIIMELAGNDRMRALEEQLRYQIYIISYKSFQESEHLSSSLDYHQKILEAMRARDNELAMELVEAHVIDALRFFVAQLSD